MKPFKRRNIGERRYIERDERREGERGEKERGEREVMFTRFFLYDRNILYSIEAI